VILYKCRKFYKIMPQLPRITGELIILIPIVVGIFTSWQVGICVYIICMLLSMLERD
jgi:phage shock protein PspC (stress-responsive transcriptional regulator)